MSPSLFSTPSEARLGSLNVASFFPGPPLPNIIAEWAAIIPLVVHLASQRDDYMTTGDVALMGGLSVGLFPRLGTLMGFSRLLLRGTKFLDNASSRGGSSSIVWDVSWGSVFPCANGAASSAVMEHLLAQRPECPSSAPGLENLPNSRHQTLNVFQFHRKTGLVNKPWSFSTLRGQAWYRACFCLIFIALATALCFVGAYGTAAMLLCSAISEAIIMGLVKIHRPVGYMKNNEPHDASMLLASHQNAIEWNLFIGDRGVVDTLLNKPMFTIPADKQTSLSGLWFHIAHVLQLAAMTFVAAQRGWDGIALAALLILHLTFEVATSRVVLAQKWLQTEGIDAQVHSFRFTGRMAMIGAIQAFSGSSIKHWMDDILAPHPRREALLNQICGDKVDWSSLPESDKQRVLSIAESSREMAALMRRRFE